MRILHVTEQGSTVRTSGERLEVSVDGLPLLTAGLHTLEALVLHGAVQLTAPAASRLLAAGIPSVYVGLDGRLKGRLEPVGHPAARLRSAQALAAADPARRLAIAREIVRNKLTAQARLLRALRRPESTALLGLLPRVRAAETLDELRGAEGWAGRVYFAALRAHLSLAGWRRARRPARDLLNALFNYGYALLMRPASIAVAAVGLDPYQGFLHCATRSQPALVLDLIEEFRAPLVDLLVVRLYPTLSRDTGWFEQTEAGTRLALDVRKQLIAAFEARLTRATRYRPTGRREEVGRLFELQARAVARAIRTGGPVRPAW